jgi:hypothetical protein
MSASFWPRLQRFELLLAVNGGERLIKYLVVNQPLDSIFPGQTVDQLMLVFIQPALQVRRNTDVKNSTAAREGYRRKIGRIT